MGHDEDCMHGYTSHFSRHNMSSAEFFAKASSTKDGGPHYSFAGPLRHQGNLSLDVQATDLAFGSAGEPQEDRFTLPYLWMGASGAVTPTHYDNYHNMYVQVQGRKTFILFPPSAFDLFKLYPSLHPAHRSAQVLLQQASGTSADVVAFQCTLEPGEILFLPALWFHLVQTDSFSLSVNVWSAFSAATLADEALAHTATLFSNDFDVYSQKVQVLRAYLFMLLGDIGVSPNSLKLFGDPASEHTVKQYLQLHLLQSRYDDMPLVNRAPAVQPANVRSSSAKVFPQDPDWPRFCRNSEDLNAFLTEQPFLLHVVQNTHRAVLSVFQDMADTVDAGRANILLLNIVERTVYSALGVRFVHQFLWDIVHC